MPGEFRLVPAGVQPPPVLRPVGPRLMPLHTCLWCRSLVTMVKVAGHTQCPRCHQVAEPCCEGITMSQAVETEGL